MELHNYGGAGAKTKSLIGFSPPVLHQCYCFICSGFVLQYYTVCSIRFGLRNEAIVSLIWDFWGLKGLLCDPKTGRKLLLGQKHTEISFAVSQEED